MKKRILALIAAGAYISSEVSDIGKNLLEFLDTHAAIMSGLSAVILLSFLGLTVHTGLKIRERREERRDRNPGEWTVHR